MESKVIKCGNAYNTYKKGSSTSLTFLTNNPIDRVANISDTACVTVQLAFVSLEYVCNKSNCVLHLHVFTTAVSYSVVFYTQTVGASRVQVSH